MQSTKARLRRLNQLLLLLFGGVALILVWWSVVRAGWLAQREDNPRQIEVELRAQRGTILDAEGERLAWSEGTPRPTRYYAPASAAAVGYYSTRYGTAGIEAAYDALLSGRDERAWEGLLRDTLHYPRLGRDIRLTIYSEWQAIADAALGPTQGAVVLLSVPDNAIRVLLSHPTFDGNQLDATFEQLAQDARAPLLNRATQGRYQPGLALQPFLLAAALEEDHVTLGTPLAAPNTTLRVNGVRLACADDSRPPADWGDALRQRCAAPMLALADVWQPADFTRWLRAFGLLDAPALEINTETARYVQPVDLRAALIGQGDLAVTPLQMALAWSTLAQAGDRRPAQLVSALATPDGDWQALFSRVALLPVVSNQTAGALRAALPRYATIAEHSAVALTGPAGATDAWYLGLAPAGAPALALVVVLEDSTADHAEAVGRAIFDQILTVAP